MSKGASNAVNWRSGSRPTWKLAVTAALEPWICLSTCLATSHRRPTRFTKRTCHSRQPYNCRIQDLETRTTANISFHLIPVRAISSNPSPHGLALISIIQSKSSRSFGAPSPHSNKFSYQSLTVHCCGKVGGKNVMFVSSGLVGWIE
jgi:hypothetical protein